MAVRDEIGSRGEFIFCARIMNFCGRALPYFRPYFLGEKAKTLDFFVELIGTGERTLFFFAQVKTTRKALTKKDKRLRVEMAGTDVRRASQVPAPTYLVGIDERTEIGYVAPILDGMKDDVPSISSAFPLDCTNLARLHAEVAHFCASRYVKRQTSVFSEQG